MTKQPETMTKEKLIQETINSSTIEECPTLGALNAKVWEVLKAAELTTCDAPEKFRLVGNFAGGLSATQSNGYWKAATTRNARGNSGKPKGILSDAEYTNKYFAIQGMIAANDPSLKSLIEALEAELAAHEAAKKEQTERDEKARSRELIKWFSALPLTTQIVCYEAAGGEKYKY